MENSFLKKLKKYGPWWSSFTSALIATVCGIGLTFGITYHDAAREKDKLMRTTEVWAMHSIKQGIDKLEPDIMKLQQCISTIDTVATLYYDNQMDQCSDSLAQAFVGCFINERTILDNDLEALPLKNMEILRKADDIHEISTIYTQHRFLSAARNLYRSMTSELFGIGCQKLPEHIMTEGSNVEAAKAIMADHETAYKVAMIMPMRMQGLEALMGKLKQEYAQEIDRLGITKEELDAFNDDIKGKSIEVKLKQ